MSSQCTPLPAIHEETHLEKAQLKALRGKSLADFAANSEHLSRLEVDCLINLFSMLSDEFDRIEQELYLAKKELYSSQG